MKSLSNYHKNFLLDHLFNNKRYPMYREIGAHLLDDGRCLVSGKKCIWVGGIGNFIKTEKSKESFCRTVYKFDLEYFLASEWHKEILKNHMDNLSDKKKEIEKERKNIEQEIKEISKILK